MTTTTTNGHHGETVTSTEMFFKKNHLRPNGNTLALVSALYHAWVLRNIGWLLSHGVYAVIYSKWPPWGKPAQVQKRPSKKNHLRPNGNILALVWALHVIWVPRNIGWLLFPVILVFCPPFWNKMPQCNSVQNFSSVARKPPEILEFEKSDRRRLQQTLSVRLYGIFM